MRLAAFGHGRRYGICGERDVMSREFHWYAEETTEEELKEIFEKLKRPGGEYCNGCNALFYATLAIGSYNACLRFGNQHLKLCKTSDSEVRLLKCEQCRKESK